MSLTSLLRETGSPLRSLFQECLPKTRAFVGNLNRELLALPLNTAPSLNAADAGLSGTAIDYRLRYYFGIPAISDTVAWAGADRLEAAILELSDSPLSWTLHEFLRELERDIFSLAPVAVRLAPADEMRLARNCVALSYFEQFYRSGHSAIFDGARNGSLRSSAGILQLPRAEVVEDVAAMSSAFFDSQFPLFAGRSLVLNPTFSGSVDVGGADADIIADDSLIDFKSTARTDRLFGGYDVYQLLGYPCLDYPDQYRIRKVGFSVVRRNALREWDIDELVNILSGGQTEYRVLRERVHTFAEEHRAAVRAARSRPTWSPRSM